MHNASSATSRKPVQVRQAISALRKKPFGFLLSILETLYAARTQGTFDERKLIEVREITADWQRQRIGADGGALGIHGIIARVESETLPPIRSLLGLRRLIYLLND